MTHCILFPNENEKSVLQSLLANFHYYYNIIIINLQYTCTHLPAELLNVEQECTLVFLLFTQNLIFFPSKFMRGMMFGLFR